MFLEGFKPTNSLLDKLNWPKNPKVVLTSISHLNDDFLNFILQIEDKKDQNFLYFNMVVATYTTILISDIYSRAGFQINFLLGDVVQNKKIFILFL